MKTITAFVILLLTISTQAQFRLINGKVYSLTDSQAGWTVFNDPFRVRGFYQNEIICQSYTVVKVDNPSWQIANRTVETTHSEIIWGSILSSQFQAPGACLLSPGNAMVAS
jgi:hypothetical protein